MPLHDQHPIPPIVSLRRNGDIISLLPLLKFMADANGQPVRLVVHRDYAGVLEGVSYGSMRCWAGRFWSMKSMVRRTR